MALSKCEECGNDVSDKAAACPKCGAPIISTDNSEILNELNRSNKVTPNDILCLECGYNGKMGMKEWRTWWGKLYLVFSITISLIIVIFFGLAIWPVFIAFLIFFGGLTTGKRKEFNCPKCKKVLFPK